MSQAQLSPAALVIFGITGDLASRKLLPALYHLYEDKLLPDNFRIIGVTRSGSTVDKLLADIKSRLLECNEPCQDDTLSGFGQMIQILTMDLARLGEYSKLKLALDEHEKQLGACTSRLFYLAVPSQTFGHIAGLLGQSGLAAGCQHKVGEGRLLIEKPFGYDLSSAHELIDTLAAHFSEQQIYRVDHYLAKETAQNILTFRFANPMFQAVWDSKAIRSIMITAAEDIGIEGRVGFYEQTGALRDVVQSHLLQLLALVTMERPEHMATEELHVKKLELLKSIQPIAADEVTALTARGQYQGYHQEVGNSTSITETYAALSLRIDTPRWRGVPILLRSGKSLAEKVTEITLMFKKDQEEHQNSLTLRIQPNEGISVELQAKKPGFDYETAMVQMDFCYPQTGDGVHPDAYERVLVDALRGDKTLFATGDEVLAAWRVVENVIHAWGMSDTGLEQYPKGSWGPPAAERLAADADTAWISQRLNVCPVPALGERHK